jgi:hypothetical protein
VSALCLAGGGAVVKIAIAAFSLAWTHTIEHVEWQEDWRVLEDRLVLEEARVVGSGAGMEPPSEARLVDGRWTWHPGTVLAEIVLRRAPEAGDWRLCIGADCRPLGALVPPTADPVRLTACE